MIDDVVAAARVGLGADLDRLFAERDLAQGSPFGCGGYESALAQLRSEATMATEGPMTAAVRASGELLAWLGGELSRRIDDRRHQGDEYRRAYLSVRGRRHHGAWADLARSLAPAEPQRLLMMFAREAAGDPDLSVRLAHAGAHEVRRLFLAWLHHQMEAALARADGRRVALTAVVVSREWYSIAEISRAQADDFEMTGGRLGQVLRELPSPQVVRQVLENHLLERMLNRRAAS